MTHRYLVTGAQGFIGRHLVCHLLSQCPQSIVLGLGRSPQQDSSFGYALSCGGSRVPAALPEYLRTAVGPRYRYVTVDLASLDSADTIREFCPTRVIHLAAALRGVPNEILVRNNVESTASLLTAIRYCDIEMLLFASSGGVYGNQDNLPIAETAGVQPLDAYSRSKLASEDLIQQFALQTGIPATIARIFNVCGPGQDELHFAGRITSRIASILANKSEPVVRVGSLSSTRDFLDVRDVCQGLAAILISNHHGVCNVASGLETSVGDFLELFLDSAGLKKDVRIDIDAARIDAISRQVANVNRLSNTGFVSQYSLARSCQEMLAYCNQLCKTG